MTTTSQTTFSSESFRNQPISEGELAYIGGRERNRAYELLLRKFSESKISKAELAKRLGVSPVQITRWLGAPHNFTIEIYSRVLYAICGAERDAAVSHPFKILASNYRHHEDTMQMGNDPRDDQQAIVDSKPIPIYASR